MRKHKYILLLLSALLLLYGCGQEKKIETPAAQQGQEQTQQTEGDPYQAPPFADSAYHADAAQGNDQVKLDLSATSDGYAAVSAQSSSRLKFQVLKDDMTYTYDISSDGTPSIVPLQCGNGSYTFKVMENVVDSKYAELYSASTDVQLSDEFQPFLRPSDYVHYTQDSECVKKANELAAKATDQAGVIQEVYGYICDTVKYDEQKAKTVQSGYIPDVDETLRTGKGICFDYASLAAAMLRSQGIPTKVIFGYVSPNNLYHAWNMFYTDESGWVTVDYQISGGNWNRLDLTFTANGEDDTFVGDGNNYTDVYYY